MNVKSNFTQGSPSYAMLDDLMALKHLPQPNNNTRPRPRRSPLRQVGGGEQGTFADRVGVCPRGCPCHIHLFVSAF